MIQSSAISSRMLEPRGSDRTIAKDKNFGQDRQLKR